MRQQFLLFLCGFAAPVCEVVVEKFHLHLQCCATCTIISPRPDKTATFLSLCVCVCQREREREREERHTHMHIYTHVKDCRVPSQSTGDVEYMFVHLLPVTMNSQILHFALSCSYIQVFSNISGATLNCYRFKKQQLCLQSPCTSVLLLPLSVHESTHQILKLGIQVFLDGKSSVWNSLVQEGVEVRDHRLQCLQHADGKLFHAPMRLPEYCESFAGCWLGLAHPDGCKHLPKGWK